jgi:tetratricopeptide (TPR) repeat protein
VVYRLGSEFGREPPWLWNPYRVRLHMARAGVQYMDAAEAAASHVFLANDALNHEDPGAALAHLDQAMTGDPLAAGGWRLRGEALRAMSRLGEAIDAYQRAVVMEPADTLARLGLGWAHIGNGNSDLAARAWRQTIGPRVDTFTLREMVRVYDARADREAAAAARAELARRGERE